MLSKTHPTRKKRLSAGFGRLGIVQLRAYTVQICFCSLDTRRLRKKSVVCANLSYQWYEPIEKVWSLMSSPMFVEVYTDAQRFIFTQSVVLTDCKSRRSHSCTKNSRYWKRIQKYFTEQVSFCLVDWNLQSVNRRAFDLHKHLFVIAEIFITLHLWCINVSQYKEIKFRLWHNISFFRWAHLSKFRGLNLWRQSFRDTSKLKQLFF